MGDAKRRKIAGIYPKQDRTSCSALRWRLLAAARRKEQSDRFRLSMTPVYIPYYEGDFDIAASLFASDCYYFEVKKDFQLSRSRALYSNEQLDSEVFSARFTGLCLNGFLNIEHDVNDIDHDATDYLKGYFRAGGPLNSSLLNALRTQVF